MKFKDKRLMNNDTLTYIIDVISNVPYRTRTPAQIAVAFDCLTKNKSYGGKSYRNDNRDYPSLVFMERYLVDQPGNKHFN